MKTKSGKSHFCCVFRTYDEFGRLFYEDSNHKFVALEESSYIDNVKKRYAKKGYTAEFSDIVNLD